MSNALFGPKAIFLGIFVDDAAAIAYTVAQGWDVAGQPLAGMFYFDSTLNTFKGWYPVSGSFIAMGGSTTPEGGLVVPMINATGLPSVKGMIVEPSSAIDFAVAEAPIEAFDAVGVVYNAGVADGDTCLIVVAGFADVLLEDTTPATRGNWVRTSSVAPGRANATGPVPVPPTADTHFQEVGHCHQTIAGGVGVLARCAIHFN
jgi:hypothetical protein